MTSAIDFTRRLWRKRYFLPTEHGSWVWLLGPMAIGAAVGGDLGADLAVLTSAALAAFLLRQPATMIVKILSGRRRQRDLAPTLIWFVLYGLVLASSVAGLVRRGHGRLLWLAVPGAPVFAWHLLLVSRRGERDRPGVEVVAAGVLALAAPAAYWVTGGESNWIAWTLWILTWLQSGASIVHVHLRLRQRQLSQPPPLAFRLLMGTRSLIYHAFNTLAASLLALSGLVPAMVALAFALPLLDAVDGVARPAISATPRSIGLRQLLVSLVFILVMIVAFAG